MSNGFIIMLLLACNAASADEAAFMPVVMSFEPRE